MSIFSVVLISTKVGFTGTIRPKSPRGLKSLIGHLRIKSDIGTISDIGDLSNKVAIGALIVLGARVAI